MDIRQLCNMYMDIGVLRGVALKAEESDVFDMITGALDDLEEIADNLLNREEEKRGDMDAYLAENERLSRLNTELGTQMRQMVAKQCACDCDWRQEDETT